MISLNALQRVLPIYGLWNEKGQMLAYDLLGLPSSLVRRIAAWQHDFDETENPPATGDDAWWERHEQ